MTTIEKMKSGYNTAQEAKIDKLKESFGEHYTANAEFYKNLNEKLRKHNEKYAKIIQKQRIFDKKADDKNVKKIGTNLDIMSKFDEFRALFTDEREKEIAEINQKEKEEQEDRYYAHCGIPKEFITTLENAQKTAHDFIYEIDEIQKDIKSCNYIFNNPITMSAYIRIACATRNVYKAADDAMYSTKSYYSIRWTSFPTLAFKYTRTLYSPASVEEYCSPDFLAIDDIDLESMTIYEKKTFNGILKKRFYAYKKTFLFIENKIENKVDYKNFPFLIKFTQK